MLKFDNTHIFTGYLKQLLSTFNLPTCKVYTREFANYLLQHGKEDPRVIESFDTLVGYQDATKKVGKKRIAFYANYLKEDKLCNYMWQLPKDGKQVQRTSGYWRPVSSVFYDKDKSLPGLTKTLNSPGGRYDTTTHEYLGDYLRFLRDYYELDLMSLYNCFNNNICNNMYYKFFRNPKDTVPYAVFDSRDTKYRIYAVPVKLFCDYTIAIDCSQEVEMFCGIYNKVLNTSTKATKLMAKTYKKFNRTFFSQPFIYDMLNVKYWTFEQDTTVLDSGYPKILTTNEVTRWDIANCETDLKLFIKVPSTCKSSIVILEGDYRGYNDTQYKAVRDGASTVWKYTQNHAKLNFKPRTVENKTVVAADLNEIPFKPISKLQLLAFNTNESYPFSDRLIEYLSNSAITTMDEIADNIKRAQKVMNENSHYFKIEGLWENKMQKIIYDYIVNSGPIKVEEVNGKPKLVDKRWGYYKRRGHTSKSMLFDVLGYIDRDAEKLYASWELVKNDKGEYDVRVKNSIQNVDIYKGLFDI